MGIVYLVQARAGLGALKLIRPQLADDAEFRARFRREVEAGRAVAGRYTARFIDAELDGPTPYLVTEYVDGPSLAEAVAEGGPFAFDAVVGLASGLAEALQSVHAAGVIHRDLKPSNILLGPTGPRIIDFGIARAMEATSLTQTGMSVGSPPWMAPEAARGEPISRATDVFAWGGAVVFAATGRAPFGEGRPEAVLYRIVHEEPNLGGLDPRLVPVVRSALSRDPTARPSTAKLAEEVLRSSDGTAPDPAAIGTTVLARTDRLTPAPRPELTTPLGQTALALALTRSRVSRTNSTDGRRKTMFAGAL
jgi:serine/threonine protein kinase